MSVGGVWLVILGGMLVTFLTRFSFIGLLPAERLPPLLRSGLGFVAPAVLAAIIAPALLLPAGVLDLSLSNYQLLAGLNVASRGVAVDGLTGRVTLGPDGRVQRGTEWAATGEVK